MVRISAIFIAACMVLIAGSIGVVVYLRFGFTGAESALVALGALTALAVYNAIAARKHDRLEASNQLANLARGSGDLARQLAEFGRRLSAMEGKVDTVIDRALATAQPLAAEIEELSTLVKQLANSVATHEAALNAERQPAAAAVEPPPAVNGAATAAAPESAIAAPAAVAATIAPAAPLERKIAAFAGLDRDGIIAAIARAIDSSKIDLFLQPVVTLPQRKVRYYEALSRLKADNGELVAAGDFLPYAEAGALMPKLDHLSALRCVQVVRRLLLKNREIGLFCNVSGATLTDAGFPKLLEFMEANRAIAPSLVFEFTQSAVRAMGPIEHEKSRRFGRARFPLLDRQPHRPSRRGARIERARLPLRQSAGDAVVQPGRRRFDRHPSGRFLRSARPLRHRSDRRANRKRGHGGRSTRL